MIVILKFLLIRFYELIIHLKAARKVFATKTQNSTLTDPNWASHFF